MLHDEIEKYNPVGLNFNGVILIKKWGRIIDLIIT